MYDPVIQQLREAAKEQHGSMKGFIESYEKPGTASQVLYSKIAPTGTKRKSSATLETLRSLSDALNLDIILVEKEK